MLQRTPAPSPTPAIGAVTLPAITADLPASLRANNDRVHNIFLQFAPISPLLFLLTSCPSTFSLLPRPRNDTSESSLKCCLKHKRGQIKNPLEAHGLINKNHVQESNHGPPRKKVRNEPDDDDDDANSCALESSLPVIGVIPGHSRL